MTERAPVDPDEAIAALRHLATPDWRPYTEPARQRGLDVRDWKDEVRVLLQRYDAALIAADTSGVDTVAVSDLIGQRDAARKAADLSAELMRQAVARHTALERQCIAILKAHGIDPHELGLRGDNEP